MIDGIAMKGERALIPAALQSETLEQLHSNHMGREKTRLLDRDLVYWINMKTNIYDTIMNHSTSFTSNRYNQKTKVIPHKITSKLWEVIGVDLFKINNSNFLCIVDYQNKLPIAKLAEKL